MAPSLPWIGAIPPCPPATMQLGSLHSSASYGTSFGGHVTIRPTGLTREAARVPGGLSSANGLVAVTCTAAGNRTFALDSRAVVPHLHHRSSGRSCWPVSRGRRCPPPVPLLVGARNSRPARSLRRLRVGKGLSYLPATVRRAGLPTPQQGGGHPAPDPELVPEKPPHNARHHRRPGSPAGSSKSERPATTARWRRGSHSAGGTGSPVRPSRKHVTGGSSHDFAAVTVETSQRSQASITNRSSRLGV